MLSRVDGLKDLSLTTNGSLLKSKAGALKRAGLQRITVSLDSLDDEVFRAMNDADFPVERVLRGIDAAVEAGLAPVKVNMVVKKGVNDHTVVEMARHFRERSQTVRFIEYMDVGNTNGWRLDDVVTAAQIVGMIGAEMPLEPVGRDYRGEVARRYRYKDGSGEIGIIAPVTEPFCGACSRIRLTADGQIRTCLFSTVEHSLRDVVRSAASRSEIIDYIEGVVMKKEPRHYINDPSFVTPSRTMSFIGG